MRILCVLLVFLCFTNTTLLFGQQKAAEKLRFVPNELLVQLDYKTNEKADATSFLIDFYTKNINTNTNFKTTKISNNLNLYVLKFENEASTNLFLEKVKTASFFKHIQRNHYIQLRNAPDDTNYDLQWDFEKINIAAAWERTIGGTTALGDTIVVAVLDGGYQKTHEDLQQNIFYNKNEIPNNGLDDDANGYIDDRSGWDFSYNDNNTARFSNHGTPVAAIIGADGNNGKGVSGINQHIKMLLLSGMDTEANVVRAYDYVLQMRRKYNRTHGSEGAYIVATNASFGSGDSKASDFPLWCAVYDSLGAAGILSVAATSNDSGQNTDTQPDMPTDCSSEFLITVTNTDFQDRLLGAYGLEKVDLAAPGEGCYTVYANQNADNEYGDFGGTSGATPHVAGAVALLYAMPDSVFARNQHTNPVETARLVKKAILKSVDKVAALRGKVASDGRLNVGNAMQILQNYYTKDKTDFLVNAYPNPFQNTLNLQFLTTQTPIEITVFDAIGRVVIQKNIAFATPNDGIYTLKTDELTKGFYTVQVRFENGKYQVKKVVRF